MNVFAISGTGGVRYSLDANIYWILKHERP